MPWDVAALLEFAREVREENRFPAITICTGRPQPYVEVLGKLLGIAFPMICENGAVIYSLSDNRARYGPGVTTEKLKGLRRVRQVLEEETLPQNPGTVLQFGKDAQISIYSQTPPLLEPVRDAVEALVQREGLPPLVQSLTHYYLNISLEDVNKGRALSAVCEELGLSRDEVAAIGDTEGDLPMREAACWFGAPANATEAVKARADAVASARELAGVRELLKWLADSAGE